MAKISRGKRIKNWTTSQPSAKPGKLRIVGGKYRGRQIQHLDPVQTRPMKDNVREALFNLVGAWIPERAVIDLFAGTGAIGIEAISRGATRAILIERHIPTAKVIRSNIATIDPEMPIKIETADTFFWGRQFLDDPQQHPTEPWVVFCSAPYDLYIEETEKVLKLLQGFLDAAPDKSLLIVETDSRFLPSLLPDADQWKSRQYSPALISVYKKNFKPEPVERHE